MTSFTQASEQPEDLGLNIVYEEAIAKVPLKGKKPKKRNKYEKRREKSSRATAAKQLPAGEPVLVSGVESSMESAINGEEETTAAIKDAVKPDETVELLPQIPVSEAEPISVEESANANSRKSHKAVTSLEDDEERAKYMAEFHARPLEMDRRSGASSRIAPSKASTHLFQDSGGGCDTLGLHPRLTTCLTSRFLLERPTIIQQKALLALENKGDANLFVQSETGSGKTLAFLLPIIQNLAVDHNGEIKQVDRQKGGTRCIILCPTRELASQTVEIVEKLCSGSFSWLVAGCLSGGEKRKSEKARLRKGISILVATPGRLLDHLGKTESILMALKGKLEWLVLDEADRLLDMGLGGQVEQIVQHVRANQPGSGRDGVTWRSVLVSATVSPKVEELAKKLLGGSEWVWARGSKDKEAQDLGLSESTPRQLSQSHLTVTAKLRLVTLIAFLVERIKKNERTVVFMSTCDGVDFHHKLFEAMDCILPMDKDTDSIQCGIFGSACDAFKLHGSVPHAERQLILKKFNGGCDGSGKKRAALLLATDVAARGLNLSGVDWTVQYDPPCEVADYAHRVGRAARAGKAGHSLLFLLPSEKQFLDVLQLKGVNHVSALSLASTLNHAGDFCTDLTASGKKYAGGGLSSKTGEAFSAELQRRLEEKIVVDDVATKTAHKNKDIKRKKGQPKEYVVGPLMDAARKAYMSYLRSYPTKEKAVRHIFSTRALHLGHLARSFALKDPPTQVVHKSRKSTTAVEDDIEANNKKRNSNLVFDDRLLADVEDAVAKKRQRRETLSKVEGGSTNHQGTIDTGKARQMLMARAAKLQDGGMDAF